MQNKTISLLILCILSIPAGVLGITADEITKEVEKLMFPNAKSRVVLTFKEPGGKTEIYDMFVYAKDNNQKVIVRFTAPPRMIGSDLIMLEKNVWSYDARAGRVMKIPSNQSFGGTDFSYGDVVRLNISDNYNGTIISENPDTWTLKLTAKERTAPYYRLELEVMKKGCIPVKGVCYGKNNKLIKTVVYSDVTNINNKLKPVTLSVTSPYEQGRVSIMTTTSEILKELPDNIFNKRNLALRLEEKY